jgi:hypothetical protein
VPQCQSSRRELVLYSLILPKKTSYSCRQEASTASCKHRAKYQLQKERLNRCELPQDAVHPSTVTPRSCVPSLGRRADQLETWSMNTPVWHSSHGQAPNMARARGGVCFLPRAYHTLSADLRWGHPCLQDSRTTATFHAIDTVPGTKDWDSCDARTLTSTTA